MRQAAGDSRLATTRAPLFSAVPSAAARRTATSGVRSTFTSPETPSACEQARRRARLPDQALVDLGAGLDLLVRVDPHAREDGALRAERDLVADRRALLDVGVGADVAVAADDGALDPGAAADVGRGVDHAALGAGPLEQRHARREHGVRADRGVRGDPAVVPDEGRALDRGQIVDLDALPEPDVAAQADSGDVELHALVEGVEVRLPELVEVADVLPVAVEDVAVERPAHLQQQREQLLREVVRAVVRDVAQASGSTT